MTYYINIWKHSRSNGTACIWRGSDRREFEKKQKELTKKYRPYRNVARLAVFQDRVIFSFANSGDAFPSWLEMTFLKAPLAVRYLKIERG